MKSYEIEITETISRLVEIDADSKEEAYQKISKMYKEGEIILDSSDYIDYEIKEV